MRVKNGRVMHRVEPSGIGLRSMCRRKHPVKGVSGTLPRVEAYPEYWTKDNPLGYPNCQHCPEDVITDE
jgi:hypothetical protein